MRRQQQFVAAMVAGVVEEPDYEQLNGSVLEGDGDDGQANK